MRAKRCCMWRAICRLCAAAPTESGERSAEAAEGQRWTRGFRSSAARPGSKLGTGLRAKPAFAQEASIGGKPPWAARCGGAGPGDPAGRRRAPRSQRGRNSGRGVRKGLVRNGGAGFGRSGRSGSEADLQFGQARLEGAAWRALRGSNAAGEAVRRGGSLRSREGRRGRAKRSASQGHLGASARVCGGSRRSGGGGASAAAGWGSV